MKNGHDLAHYSSLSIDLPLRITTPQIVKVALLSSIRSDNIKNEMDFSLEYSIL